MQLTQFSDFSFRLLLYLATHPDRVITLGEVSQAYGISQHHLVKVVQGLVQEGLVTSVRGRTGGLRLKMAPESIKLGRIVRLTEPHMNLVECFDRETNACPIDAACALKGIFQHALREFFAVLDAHTLADCLPRAPALIRLWKSSAARRQGPQ